MALNPDDLRFVLAISRGGSLLAAARALGVDKATVVRRVDALEGALGARVVERSPRGWRLTTAGTAAVEAAAEVEGVLTRLAASLADRVAGVVRLTAPGWFAVTYLIPELSRFQAAQPGVELRLLTTNDVLDMSRREADLAVRNVRPDKGTLVSRRLGALGQAIYASRAYVEARGRPARDDLGGHHLLGYDDRVVHARALAWLNDAGVPVALRVTDTLSLRDGCRAGLGLAALPCPLGDADRDLVRLDLGLASDDIFAVYPEELREAARLRVAVDWLAELWTRHAVALEGR